MCALQGKGIWTLYEDIDVAVARASEVGAKYILCKVSNHGLYSHDNAQAALAKVRAKPGLVPIAWTYSYLDDIDGEVECARCALADGFEAFVIDAEADINLKFSQAELYAQKVLLAGIDTTRLYLCSDPRLDAKIDEIPCIPLAKVCKGGFLPMIYGEILPSNRAEAAAKVMKASYEQYERHQGSLGFTVPLSPVIATYWDNNGKARMNYAEFKKWCNETQVRKPTFVSLYRAGVTSTDAWLAFKELEVSGSVVVDEMIYVQPTGPGYSEAFYPPAVPGSGWTEFIDDSGHITRYRKTSPSQTMYATYQPVLPSAGRYIVDAYVPKVHATTKAAQYFVVAHPGGVQQETAVTINQLSYSNDWAPIGTFDLDPALEESGRVNLVDLTNDPAPKDIAFTTLRWRLAPAGGAGYDAPIGTEAERATSKVWPGDWVDANPYLHKYDLGYHTGADLNLNKPFFDADKNKPVYAIADGEVIYAQKVPNSTWGGLVVIRHAPLPDGKTVYSRYGHVEKIMVKKGDLVTRGQQISMVGLYGKPGRGNYHLHFDISTSGILEHTPNHWPSFDLNTVKANYVDPRKFIEDHRP